MAEAKSYLTTPELAEELGVSPSAIRYWAKVEPEIRQLAMIKDGLARKVYYWPPDAPDKIREIVSRKRYLKRNIPQED